jgi:hypothetical protein
MPRTKVSTDSRMRPDSTRSAAAAAATDGSTVAAGTLICGLGSLAAADEVDGGGTVVGWTVVCVVDGFVGGVAGGLAAVVFAPGDDAPFVAFALDGAGGCGRAAVFVPVWLPAGVCVTRCSTGGGEATTGDFAADVSGAVCTCC